MLEMPKPFLLEEFHDVQKGFQGKLEDEENFTSPIQLWIYGSCQRIDITWHDVIILGEMHLYEKLDFFKNIALMMYEGPIMYVDEKLIWLHWQYAYNYHFSTLLLGQEQDGKFYFLVPFGIQGLFLTCKTKF